MHQNQADWQAWYDRHGPALLLFARQITHSLQEAEDAVHDGFVRFWKRRERVDDPLAYLYRAVRSAAIDRIRSDTRRQLREQAVGHHVQPRPDQPWQQAARGEAEQQLRDAMELLEESQRELIVMKVWGGLTYDQIAHALDLPRSTAAARYSVAIKALQSKLAIEEVL